MPTMRFDTTKHLHFFKKELQENLLSFWMPRCLDEEHGGYLNCFSNDGSVLVSKDKYTWSQGRFLWVFSRLSQMEMFDAQARARFLSFAKSGRDFLARHVLIGDGDWRCVFLMEADGTPKHVGDHPELDMSIFADCFVVMGFAAYAVAAGDAESFAFAKKLGESVWERYATGNYRTLPYPLSPRYRAHSKPMILTNVCCELYKAAACFDPDFSGVLRERIAACQQEVFEVFADASGLVHEFRYAKGDFPSDLFGQHVNPGHVIEDMWFQLEACELLGTQQYREAISTVAKRTLALGWDSEYGGFYHFIACNGKGMEGEVGEAADEPQMRLVLDDWASKLWWVHSEALYTTLLLYDRTGDEEFLSWFEKIFQYVFSTFPNPDKEIGEWIQIRTREGKPQEKVVALPVKDPYHITRNVILLIELLEKRQRREIAK